jgi:hypothetical protein
MNSLSIYEAQSPLASPQRMKIYESNYTGSYPVNVAFFIFFLNQWDGPSLVLAFFGVTGVYFYGS